MMLRKRLRSRGAVLAAVGAVVALSAGLGAGIGVITQTAVADGAAAVIASARGDDAVVRVAIRWAGQEAASDQEAARAADDQDAAVREALASLMPRAGLDPATSIRSEPLEVGVEGDDPLDARMVLLSDATLVDRVAIVDGAWPATDEGAALAESAAQALDVQVGDRLVLRAADDRAAEVTVTVVALWRPLDAGDPVWGGDPLIRRGVDGSVAGPLIIDERVWRALDTRPIAQWIASLEPGRASAGALGELAVGLPLLAAAIDDDPRSQGTGIVVDGGLARIVSELRQAAAGVDAIIPVVLALVAVASLTTLLELQRLLAAVRRDETVLLRSRGASPRRLATSASVEALMVGLPSALVGAAVGTLSALAARSGATERSAVDAGALLLSTGVWAGVAAVATVLVAAVIAIRSARAALRRDALADSGRGTRAVSVTALVLIMIAAGVSVGQFVLYRGAVVPTADGGSAVDLVAAVAPVLVLLAGVLLAVLLVEPLARFAARLATGRDSVLPVLIARPLARSAVLVTAPVLLLSLAVGALVVAATLDSTTRTSSTVARELALGAPLTVSGGVLDGDALASLGASGPALTLGGEAWSAAPVAVTAVTIAGAPATLVALDASTLGSLVATAGGAVEPGRLALAIETAPLPGVDVPASSERIRLADEGVRADFWVADARGGVARILAGDDGSALLPGTDGPWRVIALDVHPLPTSISQPATELDVVLTGIVATAGDGSETRIALEGDWQARPDVIDRFGGEVRPRTDGRSGFTATLVREDPGAVRVVPDPVALRFAVTPAVAERFGAVVGDSITLSVPGTSRRIEGEVADILRAVPGASTAAAVAVDLTASVQRQLAESANPPTASALWLAPDDGRAHDRAALLDASAELREIVPPGYVVAAAVESTAGALAEGARIALWTAALGALLLASATVAVVSRAIDGTRAVDVVVLRAIGVGARLQRRARGRELAIVLAAAVLAGATVGTATSAVLVGDLARVLLVDAPPALRPTVEVDPLLALALAVAVALTAAVLVVDTGRRAARQVARLSAREVLR